MQDETIISIMYRNQRRRQVLVGRIWCQNYPLLLVQQGSGHPSIYSGECRVLALASGSKALLAPPTRDPDLLPPVWSAAQLCLHHAHPTHCVGLLAQDSLPSLRTSLWVRAYPAACVVSGESELPVISNLPLSVPTSVPTV